MDNHACINDSDSKHAKAMFESYSTVIRKILVVNVTYIFSVMQEITFVSGTCVKRKDLR